MPCSPTTGPRLRSHSPSHGLGVLRRLLAPSIGAAAMACAVPTLSAQSLLDRPDNLATSWVGSSGTLYFNFVHRFSSSAPPERKVTNFPTFLVAAGFASRALVGVNYATNSDLAARYPNEYELFARYAPMQQDDGALLDVGMHVDYNVAVRGVDGELSLARREGPLRLIAVGRAIADTLGGSRTRLGAGLGGTLRLGRFVALAGDVATLAGQSAGERAPWSAGVHLALPNTPHTLSLHVSNATTSTLQGLSRGGAVRRYGFEFTVPFHVRRLFTEPAGTGPHPLPVDSAAGRDVTAPPAPRVRATTPRAAPPLAAPAPAATTATPSSAATARTDTVPAPAAPATATGAAPDLPTPRARTRPRAYTARMRNSAYIPSRIEVEAGTTITWRNHDALIHTVTAVDRSFDSGVIAADGVYRRTFTTPGTYPLFCVAHPFMKATVTVR